MELPPGLIYLAEVLPLTLFPSAVTYAFLSRISPLIDLGVPPLSLWTRILVTLFAPPVCGILVHFYKKYQNTRDAAARGATPIPVVYDKWPGGISLITSVLKSFTAGYPGDFLQDWCERYGNTVTANLMFTPTIFTIEPEYIKRILATEFDNYWKGPDDLQSLKSLLGFGVFNADGEMWKFHRNLSRPFFSQERIRDFEIFDVHTRDTLFAMKKRLAEGYPVEFQDCVARFTLDSATDFLLGRSVDSMSAGLPYPHYSPLIDSPSFLNHPSNTYVRSFVQAQILTIERVAFGPAWPLREFWKDRVKPHRDIIDAYAEPILNAELETKKRGTQKNGGRDDEAVTFLSHLVQSTDDKKVIRDSFFNILIAGRDTTAATLTFGAYMLAEHPKITEKLRKEILDTVGSSKMPNYDDLRGMKYLRAFINETLRLYPPVPLDSRASKKATIWPPIEPRNKPLYVPPNTQCRYSVFRMHRRTDLWGPDALTFDPDRFLDERASKYLTPNPFIFLPFNAGPRICLGQQFAYNEASFFLVRLLQNFSEFSLAPDAQPESSKPPPSWQTCKGTQATEKIMLGTHLTMYAKGGLWIRMKEVPTA
ncbi:cytochrome P450 monooxygenase pc-3 [Mycena leptocephala]|nr:cytochrome P450 monooxygenase pc-3 [Mycena leptocephala]